MGTPIDREKLLSIGYLSKGRSKPKVREYRDETDGHRIKVITDEHGNDITQHATPDDRQDVLIRPKTLEMDIQVNS